MAKSLKEAGFPQDLVEGNYVEKDGRFGYGPSKKTAYIPTLEEMIGACAGETFALKKQPNATWLAEGGIGTLACPSHFGAHNTPTEAVARLWLALQKNNTEKVSHPNSTRQTP